ncbi:putative aspartate aminotransferase [Diplodia seriata]|uniref:Putative aspartate aminotransferase n=1 Tax=Diplodia seriata TaxID=420778 RepID=A0A0G2DR77_9PEZI|nr:putative aspartate aminotransferase [Diplodia seriata]
MSPQPSFSDVEKGPADPINLLKAEYDRDPTPSKVDLGVGVLRDEQGACYEIPVVQEIATIQTVAGTGACRTGAVFLARHWPTSASLRSPTNATPTLLGVPTWGNYAPLFTHAGFTDIVQYQYPDNERRRGVDIASTLAALRAAPDNSIVVLQACCHNPTGRDLSRAQWTQVADVVAAKRHFAFFDAAYQGLGDDSVGDVWAVRHFVERGDVDMLVCQSFSKNAGLYSERVGALHVLCGSARVAANVLDQLRSLVRWEVSLSPAYGAELVSIVLGDEELKRRWLADLEAATGRMRALREELHALLTKGGEGAGGLDWGHVMEENGLFSFTAITPAQSRKLVEEHHIYMPENGRINVSGLNKGNIKRVAEAFELVTRNGEPSERARLA